MRVHQTRIPPKECRQCNGTNRVKILWNQQKITLSKKNGFLVCNFKNTLFGQKSLIYTVKKFLEKGGHTKIPTNIATYRLNRPMGQFSKHLFSLNQN